MDITELLKDRMDSVEITLDLTPEEITKIWDIAEKKNCFDFKLENLTIFHIEQDSRYPITYSTNIKFINEERIKFINGEKWKKQNDR